MTHDTGVTGKSCYARYSVEGIDVTGQVQLDGYADAGVIVAIDLVNRLCVASDPDPTAVLAEILAVDPPSVDRLMPEKVGGFVQLARELHAEHQRVGGHPPQSPQKRPRGTPSVRTETVVSSVMAFSDLGVVSDEELRQLPRLAAAQV